MKKFNNLRIETLEEKLKSSDPTGKWIHDFVHSDNPKFAGKSKEERIRMALGASYGAKKVNEKIKTAHEDPPFDPDPPKKNPSAVAGKYGQGYSTAKHLAKRGMAQGAKKVNEEVETTHEDPLVLTKDSEGNIHTHANLSVANAIHGTDVKHQAIHTGMPVQAGKFTFELSKHHASSVKEAKEKTEYDYEGDMARGQLQSIIMNAQRVHDMLEDNDNLPEWVQSKITLAEDYISTVSNYMASEIDEMHLSFGSQDKKPAPVSAKLADMKKYFATNDKDQMKQKITGKKFHDMSEYETWMKSNKSKGAMQVASFEPDGENTLDELSKNTLQNYKVAGHKKFDSIRNNTDSNSMAKKAKLEKGIKKASAKQYPKPASTPAPKADPNSRGYEKGRYMGDSVEQDSESQIDELKSSTYQSYVDKVANPKVASKRGNTQKGVPKSIKAIGGVTKAIGKQNFAARLASAASRNF
jgi:hypothetical protein